jgi:acyl-CoA synthetase (NDP forming)
MSAYLEAVYQPMLQLPAETGKPIVMSSFFGRRDNVVCMLQDAAIPVYDTPEQAVGAMAALARYGDYLRSVER